MFTAVCTETHSFTHSHKWSHNSLKPVPAELVVVLLQYTDLVCVVISERPTAHIKKTVTYHEER